MIIYGICLVFGLMFTLASAFLGHLFGGHDSIGAGGHAAGLQHDQVGVVLGEEAGRDNGRRQFHGDQRRSRQ